MVDKLDQTIKRKDKVMQRILRHLTRNSKEKALCLLMGWMSIEDLEHIANFWDERRS